MMNIGFIFVGLYHLISFTDFNKALDTHYALGTSFSAIQMGAFLANMIIVFMNIRDANIIKKAVKIEIEFEKQKRKVQT